MLPVLSPAHADKPASCSQESLAFLGPIPLPIRVDGHPQHTRWYVAAPEDPKQRTADHCAHVCAAVFGDLEGSSEPPLVRIHSCCFTGDVLGSLRCDCGPQLTSAIRQMAASPSGGVLVYAAGHEGRGIGLWAKAAAYLLQDDGLDTYQANRALGFPEDERDYRHAATIVRHLLGDRPIRLLTNNPDKVNQLAAFGLRAVVQEPLVAGVSAQNRRYLEAKRDHGHVIRAEALTHGND